MPKPTSKAMLKARKLLAAALAKGKNPSNVDIARLAGVHWSSMYKDLVCIAIRAQHAKPSKVGQGAALVASGALNQRDAAKQVGVSESGISKFRKRQQQKEQQDA